MPATFGNTVPEGGIPWHDPQVTVAWQSVALKHPGAVPAGADGDGGGIGELAPFVWQSAQTAALPWSVVVWVYVSVGSHVVGCGALPPWQEEQAVWAIPPEKFAPWHVSQDAKPAVVVGADFAATPCCVGSDQPAGCPTVAWQRVALKHPGAVPTGADGDGGGIGELAPFVWQSAQTVALPVSVVVWVYVPVIHEVGCGPLPPWQPKQDVWAIPPEKFVA